MVAVGNSAESDLADIFANLPKLSPDQRHFIVQAYERANKAHEGQQRKSGEPYMVHCLAVAEILSELRLDHRTLAAALLHDTVEDTSVTLVDIENWFGQEVAKLVDGVTKLEKLPTTTAGMNKGRPTDKDAETLRKIFLAMSNDIRIVLIKLADRLHNMRTLGHLAPEKQQRMAKETLEIFAPLANRLGIWQMKWELEDLCFRYLNPEKYKEIASQLAERRTDRERDLERVKAKLMEALAKAHIHAQISARPKHIYSIYRKMERKGVDFASIYDARAVRVLVEDKNTCYIALGIVHDLWRSIPSEFDDYISSPKENFYRSLHTAVMDDTGKTLEVQIRTQEMHEHAEYGIAAHWRYKEGREYDRDFEDRLRHVRRLMESALDDPETQQNAAEFVDAMKSDVFQSRVYVFTPKGDIIDLPTNSTPIDFAYQIHTDVGNRCRGARVNGQMVGLDYRLKPGDRVEIVTSKRGGPSLDWLNPNLGYTATKSAQAKIRAYFKRLNREKNIAEGRNVVDRELRRLGLTTMQRDQLAAMFNMSNTDDFLAEVGYGNITGAQIAQKILEQERRNTPVPDQLVATGESLRRPVEVTGELNLSDGSGNTLLYNLARCCNPVRGEPIVGYVSRDGSKGIVVHRSNCQHITNGVESERLLRLTWGNQQTKMYPVPVIITAFDREGLMRDVGEVAANESVNMNDVNINSKNGIATFLLTMEMADSMQLSRVLAKIEQIPNIIEVRRRNA
jgi:GTP diphosphokinase / guanosine-3',5'-bis(diphosphate) 3'-diphosphatase